MTFRPQRPRTSGIVPHLLAIGAAMLVLATLPASIAAAQAPEPTRTFANQQYRYTVDLPAGCRHEQGPGTLDAICSKDLDPERSAQVSSAAALVMEVSAETVSGDAGTSASDLAQRFGEAAFREELPQAVCGESEPSRARISNLKQTLEESRVVYTADVICAEVRFLQIAERRAAVKYVIAPDARYRLVARAPIEDFENHKPAVDSFLGSFRVLPNGKQSQ